MLSSYFWRIFAQNIARDNCKLRYWLQPHRMDHIILILSLLFSKERWKLVQLDLKLTETGVNIFAYSVQQSGAKNSQPTPSIYLEAWKIVFSNLDKISYIKYAIKVGFLKLHCPWGKWKHIVVHSSCRTRNEIYLENVIFEFLRWTADVEIHGFPVFSVSKANRIKWTWLSVIYSMQGIRDFESVSVFRFYVGVVSTTDIVFSSSVFRRSGWECWNFSY